MGMLGVWWGRWDLNPGSPAPQAGILVQTRRRPQTVCQNLLGAKSSMHFWNLKVLDNSQPSPLLFLLRTRVGLEIHNSFNYGKLPFWLAQGRITIPKRDREGKKTYTI